MKDSDIFVQKIIDKYLGPTLGWFEGHVTGLAVGITIAYWVIFLFVGLWVGRKSYLRGGVLHAKPMMVTVTWSLFIPALLTFFFCLLAASYTEPCWNWGNPIDQPCGMKFVPAYTEIVVNNNGWMAAIALIIGISSALIVLGSLLIMSTGRLIARFYHAVRPYVPIRW